MNKSEKTKISLLESQLDRILELTTRADTKASILLAFLGVVVAAGMSTESLGGLTNLAGFIRNCYPNFLGILLSIALFLPFFLLISGFIFIVLSLFARIDKRYGKTSTSDLFFNRIADYQTLPEFEISFTKTLNSIETNLMTEIFINSKICSAKYRFFNIGLIIVTIGSVSMVILQVILAFIKV